MSLTTTHLDEEGIHEVNWLPDHKALFTAEEFKNLNAKLYTAVTEDNDDTWDEYHSIITAKLEGFISTHLARLINLGWLESGEIVEINDTMPFLKVEIGEKLQRIFGSTNKRRNVWSDGSDLCFDITGRPGDEQMFELSSENIQKYPEISYLGILLDVYQVYDSESYIERKIFVQPI